MLKKVKEKIINMGTKEKLTLEKLADSVEHTYWKFSQSQRGRSIESVYAKYIPGEVTIAEDRDKLLSFVNEANIIKCYMYGDLLTKFVFDTSNRDFEIIKNCQVKYLGGLGEYECKKLLTEACYSLEQIETIRKIFELCNSQTDFNMIFYGVLGKNMEFFLRKYKFINSAEVLKVLYEKYQTLKLKGFKEVKKEMLKIIDTFESSRKE